MYASTNKGGTPPIPHLALMRTKAARDSLFSLESVRKLRADFLLLMKNADRVSNWKEARRFAIATNIFRDYLERVVYKEVLPPLRKQYGTDRFAIEDVAKQVWVFQAELRAPLENPHSDHYRKHLPWLDEDWAFEKYLKEKDRWLARVRSKARAAWKSLDEVFEYVTNNQPFTISTVETEQVDMDGFSVTLSGATPEKTHYVQRIEKSLQLFRQRATKLFPWIVQHAPRITVHFKDSMGENAGTYEPGHIELSGIWVASKDPEKGAQIIAHEMGHHVYRSYLSESDHAFWDAAVGDDYGDLDLQTVLDMWPEGGGKYWIVDNPLKDTDPVLYLQVYASLHPPSKDPWFSSKKDIEALMSSGRKSVPVPKNPITVYATKNREESFCEAFGLLVAYGPRSISPSVRWWLSVILPNLRVASAERVALDYLTCSGSINHGKPFFR